MHLTEDPIRESGRRKKTLYVFLGLFFVFLCASIFFFTSAAARNFLADFGAIFSRSVADTMSSGASRKLVAEIDVQRNGDSHGLSMVTDARRAESRIEEIGRASYPSLPKKQNLKIAPRASESEKNLEVSGMSREPVGDISMSRLALSDQEARSAAEISPTSGGYDATGVEHECDFGSFAPTREIVFNEIAWMGSVQKASESAATAANNEWIELKNNSGARVNLSGWRIISSERLKIFFEPGDIIDGSRFYILERGDDASLSGAAGKIYSGSLANSGARLGIFNRACVLIDEIDAVRGWPGGNNETKQTLERDENNEGWHTSIAAGGTPRVENSLPAPVVFIAPTSSQPATPTSTAQNVSRSRYAIAVSLRGDGFGTVASNPAGVACGADCAEDFLEGTSIVFTATPAVNSVFDGWSGVTSGGSNNCAGKGQCVISLSGAISLVATFKLIPPVPNQNPVVPAPSSTLSGSQGAGHLLIAEVQIAGASTTHDFIKMYNSGGSSVDVGGWKLKKKTSSGNEYSVRMFPAGSSITSKGYFVWANSAGDFDGAIGANAASTQTLAGDTSLALFDSNDMIVDAVAWGSGHVNPYAEGSVYPTNPEANKKLARKTSDGEMQDTNNNSVDFEVR